MPKYKLEVYVEAPVEWGEDDAPEQVANLFESIDPEITVTAVIITEREKGDE